MAKKHLTDDERRRIRILRFEASKTVSEIAQITGYGLGQIKRALRSEQVAPRPGRPTVLTAEQIQELEEFIKASSKNRRMTFEQVASVIFDGHFGVYVIRNTLRRLGYRRYVAALKPPISEKNRRLRLQFALDHKDWTAEQWGKILWSDETWIRWGRHRKTYVTRKKDEVFAINCIVEKEQRKAGWMFWGCFSGYGKGPGIFWEKDWGQINAETYQQHIIPIIQGWLQIEANASHNGLIFMQDNAPGHAAADTRREFALRAIQTISWPPFSPDLNPIETIWCWMKDWIEDCYGDEHKPSYDRLRQWVKEAWEAIPEELLQELLASMPARMEAVIQAAGMYTKY